MSEMFWSRTREEPIFLRKNVYLLIHDLFHDFEQPRPQGAFPWLREKRPGDEVGFEIMFDDTKANLELRKL